MDAESAKKTFEPYREEMNRRKAAAHRTQETRFFARVDGKGADAEFVDEQHSFVLFSVSHVKMPPICRDGNEPGIRIYGTFATEQDAVGHARVVQQFDPCCNIQLNRTHDWIVAASSAERLSDAAAMDAKRRAVLEAEREEAERSTSEFERNVKEMKTGVSMKEEAPSAPEVVLPPSAKTSESRLPMAAGVREQRYAVASFLPDTAHGEGEFPEFLFRVYRTFDSEAECDTFVRNVASVEVPEVNIDVVSCCEWVFPQKSCEHGKIAREEYRNEELQNIMRSHSKAGADVKRFRKWEEEEDKKKREEEGEASAQASGNVP